MVHYDSVNAARMRLFEKNFGIQDENELFRKKDKVIDACKFPPCKREFLQHLLRATYISSIWKNATKTHPTFLEPVQYGWKFQDDGYTINWFEGDQIPQHLEDILKKSEGNTF